MAEPERKMSSFEKLILEKIETARQKEREEGNKTVQDLIEKAREIPVHPERRKLIESALSRPRSTAPQIISNLPERQKAFEQQVKSGASTGPRESSRRRLLRPERHNAPESDVIQEPKPTTPQQSRVPARQQKTFQQQGVITPVIMPQEVAKDLLIHPERREKLGKSLVQRPKPIVTRGFDLPQREKQPDNQEKASPNSAMRRTNLKQNDSISKLMDGPSDKVETKLSGVQNHQDSAGLEDQIQINEQLKRDIKLHPKPPLLSGLKASKRKRPKNDVFVDEYRDDRREAKKPKTPTTAHDLENSTNDEPSISDSDTAQGLRSPRETLIGRTNVPFGPGRKPPRSKVKPKYIHQEVVDTGRKPSEWYLNARTSTDKFSRSDLETIKYIKVLIKKCIDASLDGGDVNRCMAELRLRLHDMEFYQFLSAGLIKKSKVLESEGLEKIFDSPEKSIFPWDIRGDAEALWYRWMGGDLDPHLLRGIEVKKSTLASGESRSSRKLDPTYTERKSANSVGANGLMNGQWWPSRVCMLRDGAHGEIEAGIHGQTDRGAYSVVVAAGGYDDKDKGENIYYCGTESKDEIPTKGTELLKQSRHKRQPLRVFRAVSKSKYAPEKGIRYDGLYDVIDWEILKPETAAHRFHLRRQSGQDPIRYIGVEKRPTNREIMEEKKISMLLA